MKELRDIERIVELSFSNGRWVKFSSTEENIYSRERIYGEVPEDDEQQGSFKRHYDISVFTNLCKIVSLSSLVGIFVAPNFPLRMDIKIGGLGDMRLYIKSTEETNSKLEE